MNNIYFDFEYIKKNNPEFKNLTDENILDEYIKNNFIFNKDLEFFDYKYYISHNKDLSNFTYIQACNHYLMYGKKEGRKINDNTYNSELTKNFTCGKNTYNSKLIEKYFKI
jgi:hypothetical protein